MNKKATARLNFLKNRTTILILSVFGIFAFALFFINSKGTWLANAVCYQCVTSVYDVFCDDALYDGTGKCPLFTTVTYDTTSGCPSQRCVNGGESDGCGHLERCTCSTTQVDGSFCPVASCTVTWSNVPSTIKPNTNFTATITRGTSNVGWNNVMTYKDGVYVPGGTSIGTYYTWVVNSGLPGSRQLQFKVNDPNAGGSGPATTCTPSQSFNTIAPPTASITGPTEVEVGEVTGNYTGIANGTNLSWVRMYYALKSAADVYTGAAGQTNPWTTRVGGVDQNDFCAGSASCTASASTRFLSAGIYYVAVSANQTDGVGNAMSCSGNPNLPSGWTDCGPSDRLTVDASDVTAELKIEAVTTIEGTWAARTSGLLSTQGGKGIVNPMKITLSKKTGSVDIKDYYVALHSGDQLSSSACTDSDPNTICGANFANDDDNATLQGRISGDPQKGFLLWYIPGGTDKNVTYCPSSKKGGKFYVWNGGCWTDVVDSPRVVENTEGVRVYQVCKNNNCGSNPILFTVTPDKDNSNLGQATWRVQITKDFTSKSLWTPIYAVDTGGRKAFNSDFIKPENLDAATGNYTATIHFR